MEKILINQMLMEKVGGADKCSEIIKRKIEEMYSRETKYREKERRETGGREIR